jgi:PPP family 3-phenylpropionic acid transporter
MIFGWPRLTYGVRLSALFGALFLIYGVQLTYLPVWLNARGLSAPLIAFATSAPLFLRLIFTPTVAVVADRTAAHRLAIILLGWAGFWLLLAMSQARSEAILVALVVVVLMTLQSIMPLTDTIAVKAVRTHGIDYGGMRLWGSLAFILATLAAGLLVDVLGSEVVLWMLVAATLTTVLVAHILPLPVPTSDGEAAPNLSGRVVLALLADRRFLLFVLASSGIQASHAMFYVFGVLHWRALGLGSAAIGFLWAVGVIAEIGLFWASRRATSMLGPIALIVVGGVAGVLRWTLMATDPPFLALFGLQVLHALTYAATHLGAMQYIGSMVAEDKQGSAQALLSTFTAGIAMGAAILIAGVAYASFAGAAYLVMAIIAAAGIAAALALSRFCVAEVEPAARS